MDGECYLYVSIGILFVCVCVYISMTMATDSGLVLKYTSFRKLQKEEQHQDELYWEVPEERKDE